MRAWKTVCHLLKLEVPIVVSVHIDFPCHIDNAQFSMDVKSREDRRLLTGMHKLWLRLVVFVRLYRIVKDFLYTVFINPIKDFRTTKAHLAIRWLEFCIHPK